MFCKWCGGNLASTDTKCKRCGREVPAGSDCGGFYDLVPDAKKNAQTQQTRGAAPVKNAETANKPEQKTEMPRTKKPVRKPPAGLFLVTPAVLALVALLLIVLLVKVNGLQKELRTIRKEITASEQVETAGTDLTTGPMEETTEPTMKTEPTTVPAPVLADQNVRFAVRLDDEDEINAHVDLGDYEEEPEYEDDWKDNVCSVGYTLQKAGTGTSLEIEYDKAFNTFNKLKEESICVSYKIDESIYALPEETDACKWQYRVDGDAQWKDFAEDTIDRTDEAGKTKLSISKDSLEALDAKEWDDLELRCEISLDGTQNGSLTIEIEGICLG